MDNYQIKRKVGNDPRFSGVFCPEELPELEKRPVGMIINLDKCGGEGTHWVTYWINKDGSGEFFDSFGRPPNNRIIKNYISKTCKELTYSQTTLQHADAETCGMYCIFYLKHKLQNKSMNDILQHFTKIPLLNELIINTIESN